MLTNLAEILESCKVIPNCMPEAANHTQAGFLKPCSTSQPPLKRMSIFTPFKEWQMLVDLRKQQAFQREVLIITLKPNIVMWSKAENKVLFFELTTKL